MATGYENAAAQLAAVLIQKGSYVANSYSEAAKIYFDCLDAVTEAGEKRCKPAQSVVGRQGPPQ